MEKEVARRKSPYYEKLAHDNALIIQGKSNFPPAIAERITHEFNQANDAIVKFKAKYHQEFTGIINKDYKKLAVAEDKIKKEIDRITHKRNPLLTLFSFIKNFKNKRQAKNKIGQMSELEQALHQSPKPSPRKNEKQNFNDSLPVDSPRNKLK